MATSRQDGIGIERAGWESADPKEEFKRNKRENILRATVYRRLRRASLLSRIALTTASSSPVPVKLDTCAEASADNFGNVTKLRQYRRRRMLVSLHFSSLNTLVE
jgi:hypothetical protein